MVVGGGGVARSSSSLSRPGLACRTDGPADRRPSFSFVFEDPVSLPEHQQSQAGRQAAVAASTMIDGMREDHIVSESVITSFSPRQVGVEGTGGG